MAQQFQQHTKLPLANQSPSGLLWSKDREKLWTDCWWKSGKKVIYCGIDENFSCGKTGWLLYLYHVDEWTVDGDR
jgi:hypothetical protein